MRYLVSTSDTKQPMRMVTRIASPVASRCTLANSIVAISHRENICPLGSSLTMSHHNAMPAIFTDTENNGFLAAILTCKSRAALRRLCNERSKAEATRLASYVTYLSITNRQLTNNHKERKLPLSQEQRERYDELRAARFAVMDELAEDSAVQYKSRCYRFQKISNELYLLTKHNGYSV